MIKIDIQMPTCCDECFALDEHGDYPFCLISHDQRGYTFNTHKNKMPTCPLKAHEPLSVLQREPSCTSGQVGYCPKCGAVLLENCYNPSYCGVCGQAVKWE